MAPKPKGVPKSTADKEEQLRAAFNVFDEDGSGALSLEELRAVFQRPGGGNALSDEQVDALFTEFDVNGDGVLARMPVFEPPRAASIGPTCLGNRLRLRARRGLARGALRCPAAL